MVPRRFWNADLVRAGAHIFSAASEHCVPLVGCARRRLLGWVLDLPLEEPLSVPDEVWTWVRRPGFVWSGAGDRVDRRGRPDGDLIEAALFAAVASEVATVDQVAVRAREIAAVIREAIPQPGAQPPVDGDARLMVCGVGWALWVCWSPTRGFFYAMDVLTRRERDEPTEFDKYRRNEGSSDLRDCLSLIEDPVAFDDAVQKVLDLDLPASVAYELSHANDSQRQRRSGSADLSASTDLIGFTLDGLFSRDVK